MGASRAPLQALLPITDAGRAEYERLRAEIAPRLDRIAGSIEAIRSEVLSPR